MSTGRPPRALRIAVVSHALITGESQARWWRLAERHPVDVTLLVPAEWRMTTLGEPVVVRPAAVEKPRFRVVPLPVTRGDDGARVFFKSFDARLRAIDPDVILVLCGSIGFFLMQLIAYRALFARRSRLGFFSWHNLPFAWGSWRSRAAWASVRRWTDFAILGNRDAVEVHRAAGYTKPVVLQTEIGIDEEVFKPDAARREATRREVGLDGFVIGFAGSLWPRKGLRDLFDALEHLDGPWSLLVVGDGELRGELEARTAARAWNAVFTGRIEPGLMPDHFRAMDCLVLPSKTMPDWKEQFGLVLAQAMACGVPVIGSRSGAIPEVIDDTGLLVGEGDVGALAGALQRLIDDPDFRAECARRGRRRAVDVYSSAALADQTFEWLDTTLAIQAR